MQTDQLDIDTTAETRRYSRACDTAQTLLEWMQMECLGVKWTASEVDPESLCFFVNGFEIFAGNGPELALVNLIGALQEAATVAKRIERNITAAT